MMPGVDHLDVRTTLTLDDDVASKLRAEARRKGGPSDREHSAHDRVQINYQLERVARSRHQDQEVARILRENITLQPNWPWPHGNLAQFLMDRNQLDEAVAEFEKALSIAHYPGAERQLAVAKKRLAESRQRAR